MFDHRGWHQWASKNWLSERIFRMIPSGHWASQTDPTGQEKLSPHTLTPPQCPKLNFWAFSDLNFYVLVFSPQYPLKWHTFCSDELRESWTYYILLSESLYHHRSEVIKCKLCGVRSFLDWIWSGYGTLEFVRKVRKKKFGTRAKPTLDLFKRNNSLPQSYTITHSYK